METEVLVKNRQSAPLNLRRLADTARKAVKAERLAGPAELSLLLTDDRSIRELNRSYRSVDSPTDVLAFAQADGEPLPSLPMAPKPIGDVVISVETAQRQARERKHSIEDEMDLLVVHGVLHLLGYDDQTEERAAEMRKRESAILSQVRSAADVATRCET